MLLDLELSRAVGIIIDMVFAFSFLALVTYLIIGIVKLIRNWGNKKNPGKKIIIKSIIAIFLIFFAYFILTLIVSIFSIRGTILEKPIIYLYPQKKQEIIINLNYQGKIIADYPKYSNNIKGWKVTAYPDGHLINNFDQKEYSYLFWEGILQKPINWDLSTGYIVKGNESKEFLQNILLKLGLKPKEYNELIVYWYPRMEKNKYNLVHFAGKEYTDTAQLKITPRPDSVLRVFMVFKAINEPIVIKPQVIMPFERKGFTVVEWGGTELN